MSKKKNYIICDICGCEFRRPDRLPEGDTRQYAHEKGVYAYNYRTRCREQVCADCTPVPDWAQ